MKKIINIIPQIFNAIFIMSLLAFTPSKADEADVAGVVITFDDESVTQWFDYFSAQTPDVRATFFTNSWHTFTDTEVQMLRDLETTGHEVACHTFDHSGAFEEYGLDPTRITEYLNEQIIPALNNMRADGFNPVSFSYPYGEHNEAYDTAVRAYFPYLRGGSGDANTPLNQIDNIYHNEPKNFKFLAAEGIDTLNNRLFEDIRDSFIRAKNNNEIVNLFAHRILEPSEIGTTLGVSRQLLDRIIQEAKDQGLKFYTYAQAYQIGNKGNVSTQISGNNIQINWNGIDSDFIGIAPIEVKDWQQGMPSASFQLQSSGDKSIDIINPLNQQQYRAIFYKNNVRRFISEPFYIINDGTVPPSPTIITPSGETNLGTGGLATVSWNAVPGATRYEYEAYATDSNGVVDYENILFVNNITAKNANCASGSGVCTTVETVSPNISGVWKIRSWFAISKGDYSDKEPFTVVDQGDSDTIPPIIILQGNNPVTIDINTNYIDAGATATDNVDPAVNVIIDTSAVDTSQVGNYTVTFTATDVAGNTATLTRTVIVSDGNAGVLLPPSIISPSGSTTSTNGVITLSWNSASGATSYDFSGYKVTAGNINYSDMLFNRRISAVDAGCANGGVCITTENIAVPSGVWKIRSNSDTQKSDYTDKHYFSVTDSGGNGVLLPPSIISPMGAATSQNGVVTLSWNSVSGATSYDFSGYKVTAAGNINYSETLFNRFISAIDAGCVNGGVCTTTENISAPSGVWKIRSNYSDTQKSDYSEKTFFTVTASSGG